MKTSKILFFAIAFVLFYNISHAQFNQKRNLENQANIVFGLSQIALNGYNIEGNLFFNRLALEYSHGVSLNMDNSFLEPGPDQDQGLAIHLPWTTGFGVGYRLNNWLNLRVEPKWHKFELYYDGEAQVSNNLIADYTTFTVGLGLYGNIRPFKNMDNFLKGFMIVPNVRWWPRVSSSVDGSAFTYINKLTDQLETHELRQIGMANSPFFINASLGYSIKF